MDWMKHGYHKCPIKGVCEISGIFDLSPLVHTCVNEPLGMTEDDAWALSPIFHPPEEGCPVIFSYGGNETNEFKRQSKDYMNVWQNAGYGTSFFAMPTFNLFDIVLELSNKNSPLFQAVLTQIQQ